MKPIKEVKSYLLELVFKRPLYSSMSQISCGEDADQFIREHIDQGLINYKEFFWIVLMTKSNRVLGLREISSGKTDLTTISFKEIAQVAFLANACSCILIHNHPSGNLNPSKNDLSITKRAEEVLQLIDIQLLDHIIITQESFYSFAQHNHINHL